MKNHYIKKGIGICIAIIAGALLLGYIVMHLWNWLLPAIFTGAIAITYCQALGLLLLSRILFGGWKGRNHCGGHRGYWRYRFKEKWKNMSEEDRIKFRQCCDSYSEPKTETQDK
jgi:hypothetical protein